MKIFVDTANVAEIREAVSWGVVDGVTTNPTLAAKEGKPFLPILKEICSLTKGPVSAEVVAEDAKGMVEEALPLAKVAPNVIIKIPMTAEGLKAAGELRNRGIKTNVTLVFTANQALLAAKAGATYASIFIGRLDDIGEDGMQPVRDAVSIYKNYGYKTEIIAASIRKPEHVLEAAKAGAHVATVPFPVLKQCLGHPLTDKGVQRFLDDWKKVKKS
ncbi:fructose-6-phosphate aldolase [Candidatus Micrarchaeota archaeon CG10_big_fil_rev_8_21_14_0_10_59_7]|nr:MAG: fructose-6-phosphate aldolase [Candidatus Micrarchaeota archaeon CG10_big_fil_rev_8_21_14_0_10_59_7]